MSLVGLNYVKLERMAGMCDLPNASLNGRTDPAFRNCLSHAKLCSSCWLYHSLFTFNK